MTAVKSASCDQLLRTVLNTCRSAWLKKNANHNQISISQGYGMPRRDAAGVVGLTDIGLEELMRRKAKRG
jgi:hypothetical protein